MLARYFKIFLFIPLCVSASVWGGASPLELPDFKDLLQRRDELLENYNNGKTSEIGGMILSKSHFKGDLELFFAQLASMDRDQDIQLKKWSDEQTNQLQNINSKVTELKLNPIVAPVDPETRDELYNNLVAKGYVKEQLARSREKILAKNKVIFEPQDINGTQHIIRMRVIHNGVTLRDTLPTPGQVPIP